MRHNIKKGMNLRERINKIKLHYLLAAREEEFYTWIFGAKELESSSALIGLPWAFGQWETSRTRWPISDFITNFCKKWLNVSFELWSYAVLRLSDSRSDAGHRDSLWKLKQWRPPWRSSYCSGVSRRSSDAAPTPRTLQASGRRPKRDTKRVCSSSSCVPAPTPPFPNSSSRWESGVFRHEFSLVRPKATTTQKSLCFSASAGGLSPGAEAARGVPRNVPAASQPPAPRQQRTQSM